jgi:hypothetical protein
MFEFNISSGANPEYPPMSIKEITSKESLNFQIRKLPQAD